MEDKQKLQEQELEQASGGASPLSGAYYCQNCRAYRNKSDEYITVDDGCGRVKHCCKTCGTTLVVR